MDPVLGGTLTPVSASMDSKKSLLGADWIWELARGKAPPLQSRMLPELGWIASTSQALTNLREKSS